MQMNNSRLTVFVVSCYIACFCYYFYYISVEVFYLDFRIYRTAHNVFRTIKLVSCLAKSIACKLELDKKWAVPKHYGLCFVEASLEPGQTSAMEPLQT